MYVVDTCGQRVTLDCTSASRATAEIVDGTLHLDWQGVHDHKSEARPFGVHVEIAPSEMLPTLTRWRIAIKNPSATWSIWHIIFPIISGVTETDDPDADQVFWPELWGMQITGWQNMSDVEGPCGGYGKHAMQFMGFTRGGRTLYFASHDPDHRQKKMCFRPSQGEDGVRLASLQFLTFPSGMTQSGNSYCMTSTTS